jgi:hypothetical protein
MGEMGGDTGEDFLSPFFSNKVEVMLPWLFFGMRNRGKFTRLLVGVGVGTSPARKGNWVWEVRYRTSRLRCGGSGKSKGVMGEEVSVAVEGVSMTVASSIMLGMGLRRPWAVAGLWRVERRSDMIDCDSGDGKLGEGEGDNVGDTGVGVERERRRSGILGATISEGGSGMRKCPALGVA